MSEIQVGSMVKLKVGRGEFVGEVVAIKDGIATVQRINGPKIRRAVGKPTLA
jgi:hypothetical protein